MKNGSTIMAGHLVKERKILPRIYLSLKVGLITCFKNFFNNDSFFAMGFIPLLGHPDRSLAIKFFRSAIRIWNRRLKDLCHAGRLLLANNKAKGAG